MRKPLLLLICATLLMGCAPASGVGTQTKTVQTQPVTALASSTLLNTASPLVTDLPATATESSTLGGSIPLASPTASRSTTPGATPTLAPKAWRMASVIPAEVSSRMQEIYTSGLALGNNPQAFSKVGDCQSTLPLFLADFDKERYALGEYAYLQPAVDYFAGSFSRTSRAVKNSLTATAVMATLWNDWKDCGASETPLECEYRIHQPSFAIISLGTNDANGLVPIENALRRVIEITIEHGIVPILATKADNAEGDQSINEAIARLAYEYEIPLWNFWLAVQPLPQHGLRSPEHLTYGEYVLPADFSHGDNMQYAFNVRNLTALQTLDVVWRAVTGQPIPVTSMP